MEDEALVGRSLSRHYPHVFEKIKNKIKSQKIKKVANEAIENPEKAKNLKDENKQLKEMIKILKLEKGNLIAANVGLAERIRFLNQKFK